MLSKQLTLRTGFEKYAGTRRREQFFSGMYRIMPWREMRALIASKYPKVGDGRLIKCTAMSSGMSATCTERDEPQLSTQGRRGQSTAGEEQDQIERTGRGRASDPGHQPSVRVCDGALSRFGEERASIVCEVCADELVRHAMTVSARVVRKRPSRMWLDGWKHPLGLRYPTHFAFLSDNFCMLKHR